MKYAIKCHSKSCGWVRPVDSVTGRAAQVHMCPVCGGMVYITNTKTPSKFTPKRFSVVGALQYAADYVLGHNVDSIGPERSYAGNPEGAARLCAWALKRHAAEVRQGRRRPRA